MKYVAPKLPQAPTCLDALEWGWIDPSGKAIICNKPKHLKYYSHHDTTGKNGLPIWGSIFKEGYIRYAIGHDGAALFNYLPTVDIKQRVIRFINKNPSIKGPIHLDYGGERNFDEVELLPLAEAIEYLNN
jgi:hypothetical protein